MVEIVPYKIEHFFIIRDASEYFQQLHSLYGLGSSLDVAKMYLRGPAYTMFIDRQIIGCGGIIKLWEGVGDAWVLATPLIKVYPKAVTKAVKENLYSIIQNMRFERVQAIVKVGFEVGHKWVKRLGFTEEGIMKKYFGGMDFVRYSIVTEFKE